jgi:hypothetical protein
VISLSLLLHERLATTAMFYTFAMGVWALWLTIRSRSLDGAYLGAIVVGEALLVMQVLLGATLWLGRDGGGSMWLHVLYGLLTALMWPFVYTFSRGRDGSARQEAMMFFATSFFLFLMLARAVETARLVGGAG